MYVLMRLYATGPMPVKRKTTHYSVTSLRRSSYHVMHKNIAKVLVAVFMLTYYCQVLAFLASTGAHTSTRNTHRHN